MPLSTRPSRVRQHPHASLVRATAALLAILAAQAGGGAAAQEAGELTRITSKSPFAGCKADKAAHRTASSSGTPRSSPGSTPTRRPQQPDRRLAAGPLVQRRLRGATWPPLQQGRRRTWTKVVVPEVTLCSGGDVRARLRPLGQLLAQRHRLLHDPGVRARPILPSGSGFGANAMLVNRSTNGGASWGDPITLIDDPSRPGSQRQELAHRRPDQLRPSPTPSGTGCATSPCRPAAAGHGGARSGGRAAGWTAWRSRASASRAARRSGASAAGSPSRGLLRGPDLLHPHHQRRPELGADAQDHLRSGAERADHQQPDRRAAERHRDRLLHRHLRRTAHPDRAAALVRQGRAPSRRAADRRRP